MTLPRPVYPGETTMAQKQCYGQQYRLRPDRLVRQIILYAIGYAAGLYNILLHDFIVVTDHPDYLALTSP